MKCVSLYHTPNPKLPWLSPSPWGYHHRSVYVSFSGYPCPAQLRGSQQAEGASQCRFYWGQALQYSGQALSEGVSQMEEESSKVGVMRGGEFPGNEQSKRTVSQWWTCSLQPLEGD